MLLLSICICMHALPLPCLDFVLPVPALPCPAADAATTVSARALAQGHTGIAFNLLQLHLETPRGSDLRRLYCTDFFFRDGTLET